MKTFLNIVAEDLYKHFDGRLDDVVIVFPNKRASLFFNQYLATQSTSPIWAPRYTTISELFHSISPLTVADPILLVCYLYEAYKKVMNSDETLDHFYSWGEVMLNDFDDIDNNMVDTARLFANVAALEEMTSFDYLNDAQRDAIERFFKSFDAEKTTELHKRFLKIWKKMPDIYAQFRKSLQNDGLAYEGMLKREVIENIQSEDKNTNIPYGKYVIVGFNVLNKAEEELFTIIKQRFDDTIFYWDYDNAYIGADFDSGLNSNNEAGMFIKKNIERFGNKLASASKDTFDNLRKPKQIKFIATPTDNAQCRYVEQWVKQNVGKDSQPLNRSAVVLCDEHLLQPVLHSIPSQYNGTDNTILNITMGYPMQETPIASYVTALLDLQINGWNEQHKAWRYYVAEKVLKHPYTMLMAKQECIDLLAKLKKFNIAYPREEEFDNSPFLKDTFTRHTDIKDILKYISTLLKAISKQVNQQNGEMQELYIESIFNAWTMMNRIISLYESGKFCISNPETLLKIVRQIISSRNIPFHGEPAIGLQVMGLLETRNIDFDNILMLSVGEDILPSSKHSSSFIPYSLRNAYGMTTIERQTSLYAYYFYRTIQRASNITLVYNNFSGGMSRGEMSRFMMQLKIEKNKLLSPDTIIEEASLTSKSQSKDPATPIVIEKTKEVMDKLMNKKKISPSALNNYIDCPIRFYLNYVCGIYEDEEVTEEIEANTFGSIFHQTMQYLYQPFEGRGDIQRHQIEEIRKNDTLITQMVDKSFAKVMFLIEDFTNYKPQYNGDQLLTRNVIKKYVKRQLEIDAQLCPMQIIKMEGDHYIDFVYDTAKNRSIQIGGIVDREDIVSKNGTKIRRIVDYKTSSEVHRNAQDVDSLFIHDKNRMNYIFQTLYYCEVMSQVNKNEKYSPNLVYIKKDKPETDTTVIIGKEPIMEYTGQIRGEFLEHLTTLLQEIFDPDTPFQQYNTSEEFQCKYCPFKSLCDKDFVKRNF